MPDQTVSLPEDLTRLLDAQVASGRFPSREAALERAVILLDGEAEEGRRKLAQERHLIADSRAAYDAGEYEVLETDADVHAYVLRLADEALGKD